MNPGPVDESIAMTNTLAQYQTLGEGGMYIQIQHSWLDRKQIRARFPNTRTVPVFLNFPPAVVEDAQR